MFSANDCAGPQRVVRDVIVWVGCEIGNENRFVKSILESLNLRLAGGIACKNSRGRVPLHRSFT